MTTQVKSSNLASPWMRILATFIDYVIFFIISAIVTAPFGAVSAITMAQSLKAESFTDFTALSAAASGTNTISAILSLAIFGALFLAIPIYVWKGQTIGKKLLKLKIVKAAGHHTANQMDILKRYSIPTIAKAVVLIPALGCIACIDFVIIITNFVLLFTDANRQTVYDKIAETVVVTE